MNYDLNILAGKYYRKILSFCPLLIFSLIVLQVSAQTDSTTIEGKKAGKNKPGLDLFGSDEILNVSIYMDLTAFLKKTSPNDSFEAEMIINEGSTDTISKKVKLKYRGILRKELCSFPPIEVVFRKPLICDSTKIKKLKLVTHCQPGSITDEYVLREYLVYKLFNAITDTSFRARLLKVSYIDVNKKKKPIVKYGIFLEPVDMLAKRLNSMIIKSETLNQTNIIPRVIDRLAIFNYMIANWDWSVPGLHNVKVLVPMNTDAGALGIAVPYDFDISGVVNAAYAIPPPNVPIENTRQRLYWGKCRSREVYKEDLKEYSAHKEDIYNVINGCPYLSKISKRDISHFLDGFFDQLEKPKSMDGLLEDFLKTCKN